MNDTDANINIDNSEAPHVVVRVGRPQDWPLLCKSFAKHYIANSQSYYGYGVPPHTIITKLEQFRDSPAWRLLVACPSTDEDEVMGMLLFRIATHENERQAAAWITTKPLYQRKGVANALIKVAGIVKGEIGCAFLLPHIAKLAQPKGYVLRFRPYLPDVELWRELTSPNVKESE